LHTNDDKNTIHLEGATGSVRVGGNGKGGDITVMRGDNTQAIQMDSLFGSITCNILLAGATGDQTNVEGGNISCDGHITSGGNISSTGNIASGGNISSVGDISCGGDVTLQNGDCAEDFDVDTDTDSSPGTVLMIDDDGKLRPSTKAYDRRVAGVISGAGGCRPGIILGRQQSTEARAPVALTGRVYCKVDARSSPVRVGDLLTTSGTTGHAMKADDPWRAFGSVLGKALQPLAGGLGLIPILVALQ
jgi:hypothetical protein